MSWTDRSRFSELNEFEVEQLVKNAGYCILLNSDACKTIGFGAERIKFSRIIGIGAKREFVGVDAKSIIQLKEWLSGANDFVLGYFSYDVKNMMENLVSANPDAIGFSPFYFFVPETVVLEVDGKFEALSHNQNLNFHQSDGKVQANVSPDFETQEKKEYVQAVNGLMNHIQLGDIYETNYCVQHKLKNTTVEPYKLYKELEQKSPAPFSCYVSHAGNCLMSSSPERFMKNDAGKLISQPMKGTNRRLIDNDAQKQALSEDAKERAENIMITDLVRNDLSRSAKKGTVKVEELCGVYEFEHVNQMISTVSAELREDVHPLDALLNAFPMGSMTGAPKIKAMELIDESEGFSRGLYSGSVGYFTPDLDFDFNVIIRSILYNSEKRVVTFPTGSAITINSDPEKEYEEMILKAEAMRDVILNHA